MGGQALAYLETVGDLRGRPAAIERRYEHSGGEFVGAAFFLRVERAQGREVMLESLAPLKRVGRKEEMIELMPKYFPFRNSGVRIDDDGTNGFLRPAAP